MNLKKLYAVKLEDHYVSFSDWVPPRKFLAFELDSGRLTDSLELAHLWADDLLRDYPGYKVEIAVYEIACTEIIKLREGMQ